MNKIFDRFAKNCPMPVALRAIIERILTPEKLDQWFDENNEKQYTRNLLFSTLFDLMGAVVFKVFPSINAAYQAQSEAISVSITSVYNKLNGIEPNAMAALVRQTASEMQAYVGEMKAQRTALLPGYRVKMLDGNCIAKTEHRLKPLRKTKAGPLPGKSLVVYDHALDLAIDVFPCEDGHAQERSLLRSILPSVEAKDVWVGDRNFCVQHFLSSIGQKKAFFIIRQHQQLPITIDEQKVLIGTVKTGKIYQQTAWITDEDGNNSQVIRLITIQLKKATRNGDSVLSILTNLPDDIDAEIIAEIYAERWSIETMFLHLTSNLNSEIDTLGYPKAALFGFSMALIAYNILSLMQAAMRSVHGEKKIVEEVSAYYISGEISRTIEGLKVAFPDEEWVHFQTMTNSEFIEYLKFLMENANLSKYKKHKRGPKKPPPKRNQHVDKTHISTFRLLTGQD